MTRQLITSWSDYQKALDAVLSRAGTSLLIYDADLAALKLEDAGRLEHIERLLAPARHIALRLMLRRSERLQADHPRLFALLMRFQHVAEVHTAPEALSHLRDSIVLADGQHALVRFEESQARSVLLEDAPEACRPYGNRFEEIWNQGSQPIAFLTLGL